MSAWRPETVEDVPVARAPRAPAKRGEARLGTTIGGKYQLEAVLGTGGMSVVYAARHRNQNRVAIKVLDRDVAEGVDLRGRFLREGRAANSLGHPGVVVILDDDVTEDGVPYLVMELLEGEELGRLVDRHGERLPPKAVLALGHQLLDVLAAAHARGIVHRDIKPSNLFVTGDGTLKVLDFGIARVHAALTSGVHTTHTGALLGTPGFMAPEQALAMTSEIDARSDVWSAGATLFRCASGRHVHEGDNGAQLLVRAATTAAPPLASVVPDVPAALADVIDRALRFDKAERWPDAATMRDALARAQAALYDEPVSRAPVAELLSGRPLDATAAIAGANAVRPDGAPPPTPDPIRHDAPTRRTLRRPLVVGLVAVLGIGAAGAALAARGHRSTPPADTTVASSTATAERPAAGEPPLIAGEPRPASSRPEPPAAPPDLAPTASAPAVRPNAANRPRRSAPPASTSTTRPRCAFVVTLDKNGEQHFSCPCATCE